ncbi:MAG: DUF421 domain-containing protein [Eubacterium sp.]
MTIVIIRAIIIYIFVAVAVRIMGKRQVGELKPQELVITILISAVATVPLEDNSMPLSYSLLPILIFISFEILSSAISMKSLWFRNLLQGKPIFIIKNGVLQQNELTRLRFTIDDLVDATRQAGVFDISEIENAVVETNGTLSVQQKSEYAPLNANAMGKQTKKASLPITIVMDGKPVTEYFNGTSYKLSEIEDICSANYIKAEDLLLLNIDENGNVYYIEKEKKK